MKSRTCLAGLCTLIYISAAQADIIHLVETGNCRYGGKGDTTQKPIIFSWNRYSNEKILWSNSPEPEKNPFFYDPSTTASFYSKTKLKSITFQGEIIDYTPKSPKKPKNPFSPKSPKNTCPVNTFELQLDNELMQTDSGATLQMGKLGVRGNIVQPVECLIDKNLNGSSFAKIVDPLQKKSIMPNNSPDVASHSVTDTSAGEACTKVVEETKRAPSMKVTCRALQSGITPIQWTYIKDKPEAETTHINIAEATVDKIALNSVGVPYQIEGMHKKETYTFSQDPDTGDWSFTGTLPVNGEFRMVSNLAFKGCTFEEQ